MLRTMEHEMTIMNLLLHEYNWNRKKCGYIKQRLKQTKKKDRKKTIKRWSRQHKRFFIVKIILKGNFQSLNS